MYTDLNITTEGIYMRFETLFAILLIFLVFLLCFASIFRRSSNRHEQPIILFCLVILLIFSFLLLFGEIDFSGMELFKGYGFSI